MGMGVLMRATHNKLSLAFEAPTIRERSLHRTVAQFLHWSLPTEAYFSTIPGGDGGVTTAPGYAAGCPDILIVHSGRALFLELKSKKGALSDAQREAHKRIGWAGADVLVARTVDAVQTWLRDKGVPLRGDLQ